MANPNKKQGTALETLTVALLTDCGFEAERVAEGGSNDLGDVRFKLNGEWIYIECKARERLNIHQALAKASRKADPAPALVWWKRLTRKPGAKRRTPDGIDAVIAMDRDLFTRLIIAASEGTP